MSTMFRARGRILTGVAALLALVCSSGSLAPAAEAAPTIDHQLRMTGALQRKLDANPSKWIPVILQMNASAGPGGGAAAADASVRRLRQQGHVVSALPMLAGAAGVLPAAAIRSLANDPAVAFIHEDMPVRRRSDTVSPANLSTAYPQTIGATQVWQQGDTGQGITIAVLDSGITPDLDLIEPTNRILASVNFADPLGTAADPGGHGTHIAGILAGNGTRSAGQFIGIAPNANLVDVRVLQADGSGSMSSVIAGIQWVVNNKDRYGIRILNLSLGAPTATTYEQDPIAAAAEIAWLRGIVVVGAAGNNGAGAVDTPGIDPFIITVGATDDNGTPASLDDSLPSWSGWASIGSGSKPDLVANGRRIVSIRAPGSTLDRALPERVVSAANGSMYFRLSGTSMSTAVVSGAIALLLQQRPLLSPNQVKAILIGTAQLFGQSTGLGVPAPSAGAGLLNIAGSIGATSGSANHGLRAADGSARALYQLLYGQPLAWQRADYEGINWSSVTWSTLQWNYIAWDNLSWDSFDWASLAWDKLGWDNLGWDAIHWANLGWDTGAVASAID